MTTETKSTTTSDDYVSVLKLVESRPQMARAIYALNQAIALGATEHPDKHAVDVIDNELVISSALAETFYGWSRVEEPTPEEELINERRKKRRIADLEIEEQYETERSRLVALQRQKNLALRKRKADVCTLLEEQAIIELERKAGMNKSPAFEISIPATPP